MTFEQFIETFEPRTGWYDTAHAQRAYQSWQHFGTLSHRDQRAVCANRWGLPFAAVTDAPDVLRQAWVLSDPTLLQCVTNAPLQAFLRALGRQA